MQFFRQHNTLRALLILSGAILVPSAGFTHGGGLDANGCHNNRKTGDYHCHRATTYVPAPTQTRNFSSPEGSASKSSAPAAESSGGCPCGSGVLCTGPRGGRYCITSGGSKSYR